MPYYVIGTDGQKYGPVDPYQLQTWAAEGRITQQTFIEDLTSGARIPAMSLPFLNKPASITAPPPPSATPPSPPPVATGTTLPIANMQTVPPASGPKPAVRRKPLAAALCIAGAMFVAGVLFKLLEAGHAGAHGHVNIAHHQYPMIDVALLGLFLFWIAGRLIFGALHAWHGTE